MYKLIACDLDETLLNTDKEICARNIAAIKRAEREYGVRFVPATGRGYTCIDNVLHTLGVYDAEQEYTISNNGGVVTENKNYRKLSFHELPYEIAEKLKSIDGINSVKVETTYSPVWKMTRISRYGRIALGISPRGGK